MIRLSLLTMAGLFLFIVVKAQGREQDQNMQPIKWTYTAQKTGETDYQLHFTATIDDGWHAYSQTQPKEAIAQPTKIVLTSNPIIQVIGTPKEIGALIKWSEPVTGIAAHQYEHNVDFVQTIHLKAKVKMEVKGNLTFQVCTSESCLPPKTVPFSIALP